MGVAMVASGNVKTIVDAHGNRLHGCVFHRLPKKSADGVVTGGTDDRWQGGL
jgi:hypothetical protein